MIKLDKEVVELLREIKAEQDRLIIRISRMVHEPPSVEERLSALERRLFNMEAELSVVKSDVKTIRERQEEQDKIVDILSVRTTRLLAKMNVKEA